MKQIIKAILYSLLLIMTSCSTTSSGRGTATIVKSDGRVTYRTMNKTKCAKKRLRVAKRNYYRNQRDY